MPMALGLGLGLPYMAGPSGPSPALDLNFVAMAASQALDSRITYTGASLATLTDVTGNTAYKPHNLLTYSEQFDNAIWLKQTLTVTANQYTAPDGSTTADALVPTSGDSALTYDIAPASAVTHTFSIWLRSTTGSSFSLDIRLFRDSPFASISTQSLTLTTAWQRFTFTGTPLDTSKHRWRIGTGSSWATGEDAAAWGAQLNVGPLQPYYPTTSAAYFGPRFTYDPVTLSALGLLIEEQRTNLLLWSEAFDNAAWISSGMTISANSIAAPDGATTADQITLTNGSHSIRQNPDVTVTASTQYTLSFYAYRGTATDAKYAVFDNTHAAYIVTSTSFFSQTSGSGWSRVTLTFTTPAGCTSIRPVLLSDSGVTGTIYLWGAQLEAGATATSYIPTTSASVTRAADSVTMTGTDFSSWFNAAAGTFVGEATPSNVNAVEEAIAVAMLNSSNFIGVGRNYGGGSPTGIILWVNASGSSQAYIVAGAISAGTKYKAAASYAANAFAECVNGGTVGTDAAGTVPASLNKLNIGQTHNGIYSNSVIARLRYYNTALTNAQLQALTA